MFPRLAEQYRSVVQDLVLSLKALAMSLKAQGHVATCYECGHGAESQGASFVADLGEGHVVRFLCPTTASPGWNPGMGWSS